jgi:hypothetical protein
MREDHKWTQISEVVGFRKLGGESDRKRGNFG